MTIDYIRVYSNDVTTLYGTSGPDLLAGGAGANTLIGRTGDDSYVVDNVGDRVIENAGEGTDTVFSTVHVRLSANVEHRVLQSSADLQGYGNDLSNQIYGNAGNNLLDGGTGVDARFGGAGNDVCFVDDAGDQAIENANEGNDVVFSSAHLRLTANVENLILQGSADLQDYGNSLNNSIYGNTGNNILNGDAGADAMFGGAGNDAYFVDDGGDVVIENSGEGTDAVFSTAHLRLSENMETLVLQGGADLQGYGNSQANKLYGNTGCNLLDGGAGADVMRGDTGNDVYFVDDAGDLMFENLGEGTDAEFATVSQMLAANVETLVLQGSADLTGTGNGLDNKLFGNSGENTLSGGAENDLIDGGAGFDVLNGGAGNDTFVFGDNFAGEVIQDFTAGQDSLRFVGFGTAAQGPRSCLSPAPAANFGWSIPGLTATTSSSRSTVLEREVGSTTSCFVWALRPLAARVAGDDVLDAIENDRAASNRRLVLVGAADALRNRHRSFSRQSVSESHTG
jgi:Ca2+-binding RTX toxin-like protein